MIDILIETKVQVINSKIPKMYVETEKHISCLSHFIPLIKDLY